MRLSLKADELELDVDLAVGSPSVLVADVFAAAGLTAGQRIVVDGQTPCDPGTPLDALGLVDGTTLVSRSDRPVERAPVPGETVAELVCVAGPRAGTRTPLTPGSFDLLRFSSPADRAVPSSVFRVEVGRSGSVRCCPLAGTDLVLDGEPAGDELRPATWIAAGSSVFRASRVEPSPAPRRPSGQGGRATFLRSPRVVAEPASPAVVVPTPPAEPRAPEPLSFLVMLLPLPIGLALAYFLSPFYLVFVLVSPVMALGRTLDGRRRVKRTRRDNEVSQRHDLAEFGRQLGRVGAEAAADRRASRRDLHQLLVSATDGDHHLWRSRADHSDFLEPVIGVGDRGWSPDLIGEPSTPEAEAIVAEASTLPMCPVTVDLRRGVALGIVGPRPATRRLAGAVVAQLVVEHGPADLQLAAFLDDGAARFWDHLKWLPHLVGADRGAGARPSGVATTVAQAEQLAGGLIREPERTFHRPGGDLLDTPVPVFVVDSDQVMADGFRSLTSRLPRAGARAVIVADSLDQLPAFCTSVAEVDGRSGRVTITDVATGHQAKDLSGLLPDQERCRDIARALARFDDPEAEDRGMALPSSARLRDLLPTEPDAASVLTGWTGPGAAGDGRPGGADPGRRPARSSPSERSGLGACRGVLGVTETGPFEVDLVADGPHALIAGTTGAGKSELLRTLIVSLAVRHRPDQVSFALIDFKGGGAFDAFERLPHNVGVVTDLDEHLAARALRCLRAELTYRERRLRRAAVSDVVDLVLEPGDEPLPRLVIVVDEFATLAAELPDFLASLVDVAQRGRSLGIHLVLATQRPSGVVDAKIRANTNLRIALRVQDELDSVDVIGTTAAADIDRHHPGRALARLGAAELTGFQTALVSIRTDDRVGPPLRLEPFDLLGGDPLPAAEGRYPGGGEPGRANGETGPDDLAAYVTAIGLATEELGMAPPRVPWPDPLPTTVAAEALLADAPTEPWATPFGLVDRPDEQCQEPAWWRADDGNLAIYGLGPGPAAQAVSTVTLGLALRHRPDELHLYALDFVGSLAPLRRLPHLGGYVTAEDDELLLRTLQRLEDELDRRRAIVRRHQLDGLDPASAAVHRLPLVVLAVANYGAVIELFDEMGELTGGSRLARIVRDGPSLGVVVFIAAGSERDVPGRVAQQIETRLLTRMADPNSYLMFGLRPKDVPDLGPGRAIDVRSHRELQIAQFGNGDLGASIDAPSFVGSGGGPTPVGVLGDHIPFGSLGRSSLLDGAGWHLAVAVGHRRLEPIGVDLRDGQHLMVTGPPGSGRTTALRTLAAAARAADPDAVLAVVTADQSAWSDLRETLGLTTLDYLLSPESGENQGRRAVVLVDDVEAASVPGPVFDRLANTPPAGIHLAVAGRPESFRSGEPWVRAIAAGRSGIALRPTPEAGDLFRCRFAVPREPVPPGRGFVIDQGRSEPGQIAIVAGAIQGPNREARTGSPGDDVGTGAGFGPGSTAAADAVDPMARSATGR